MSASLPLVSVLIVNWNAGARLRGCLLSLARQTAAHEVILVDNASTDDSLSMLAAEFPPAVLPGLSILPSETNLGFARATNLAARGARGAYLLLLNPDTELPPTALEALLAFMDAHPDAAAAGPELRNADGSHQRSCWRGYPGLWMAISDAFFLWKFPGLPGADYAPDELRAARIVDHLLGACLLVRRSAWDAIGPLDESYFLFLEETDWCLRASRRGWKLYYVPDVAITHYGQYSMRQAPSRNIPQFYASYLHFYRQHHPRAHVRQVLLRGISAVACVVRICLWQLRSVRARDAISRAQAGAMSAGYRRALAKVAAA